MDTDTPAINFRKNLDYQKLTHQTLGFLIENRIEAEVYHKNRKVNLAIKKKELVKKLNISKEELFVITSKLKHNLEIDTYDVEFFGYFAKPIAVNSYISKKYLNEKINKKRENIKYYVNIFSPILTAIIALLSISLNISQWQYNKLQKTLKNNKKIELEQTHKELNYLKGKTKNIESHNLKKSEKE